MKDQGIKYELVAEPEPEFRQESPLRLLHRGLRGRYRYAVALSALLAAAGALIGYHAVRPLFVSTGMVRVEAAMPVILYPTQETEVPRGFEAYLAAQVAEIQNWSLLERAVARPEMREAGWPAGAQGTALLQEALAVTLERGEHILRVSVTLQDAAMAQTAANAVLATYEENHTYPGGLPPSAKEQVLVQREQQLQEQLDALRGRILEISDQFGTDALESIHVNKVSELMALELKLAEITQARVRLEAGEPVEDAKFLAGEGGLSALDEQELMLIAEIKSLEDRYRPSHPMLVELNRRLETLRLRHELREQALSGGENELATVQLAALERLARLEVHYRRTRDQVREEAAVLGRKQIDLASLTEEVREVKERMKQTRQRLDELRFETGRHQDRVRIVKAGYPLSPSSDRRQGLAAASALLGVGLGTGLILLVGLCDKRLRYIEDLEAMDLPAPVLSLLPALDAEDLLSEHRAVWSAHQLRNLLELKGASPSENAYAISGCDHDEGRTSVVLALGTCFAAAGRRTLVVDADFARSQLSAQLGLDEAPGLCDALGSGAGQEYIHHTSRANLWCMPFGSPRSLDPKDLSRSRLQTLLRDLRHRFDAVIIDSGPILTDIEACLITAVADCVLVVVRRNQRRELVRSSFTRLEQLGANCVGMVFNRAASEDVRHREAATVDIPPPLIPAEDPVEGTVAGVIRDGAGAERKRAA